MNRRKPIDPTLMSEKLNDLIITKNIDGIFQYDYTEDDVIFLVQIVLKEQMKQLGKTLMNKIMLGQKGNNTSYKSMMTDKLIKKYHVILAARVFAITKVPTIPVSETVASDAKSVLKAVFKKDFFETNDELLTILRETFYNEIVLTHNKINVKQTKPEFIESQLNQLIQEPSALTVSNVIGSMVSYDEKACKLKLLESNIKNILSKEICEKYNADLQNIEVKITTVNKAIEIAGFKKLTSLRPILLPNSFGNEDMTVKERRVAFLQTKITLLMKNSMEHDKIIELNNGVDSNILLLNGGLGGSVGNLLVLDEDTQMLKFNEGELPTYAALLRSKIKENLTKNDMLSNYRFKVNINDFPRISLHGTEYDKSQARNFLNKLYFYTAQGKENEIEEITKLELNEHVMSDKCKNEKLFHVQVNSIYSRFHDIMQKWWMIQKESNYLTNQSKLLEEARNEVFQVPVMTILNDIYDEKVNKRGVNVFNKMKLQMTRIRILNHITRDGIVGAIEKASQIFGNKVTVRQTTYI